MKMVKLIGSIVAGLAVMFCLTVLLLVGTSDPARSSPPPSTPQASEDAKVSLGEAVAICRLVEQGHADEAKRRFEAVDEKARPIVAMICTGYHQALLDVLNMIDDAKRAKPSATPAPPSPAERRAI